jgi:TnpA family transposase
MNELERLLRLKNSYLDADKLDNSDLETENMTGLQVSITQIRSWGDGKIACSDDRFGNHKNSCAWSRRLLEQLLCSDKLTGNSKPHKALCMDNLRLET